MNEQQRRLIHEIKTYVRRGDACRKEADRDLNAKLKIAERNDRAAGKALIKLKEANKPPDRIAWPILVREHCNLSQSRADELIRIAKAKTTAAKVRSRVRNSMRATRARRKSMTQHSGVTDQNNIDTKSLRKIAVQHHLTAEETKTLLETGSLWAAKGCNFDPENDKDNALMTDAELHAQAFQWQSGEAVRLAEESALLRSGAEVTVADVSTVKTIITAWSDLLTKLKQLVVLTREKEISNE